MVKIGGHVTLLLPFIYLSHKQCTIIYCQLSIYVTNYIIFQMNRFCKIWFFSFICTLCTILCWKFNTINPPKINDPCCILFLDDLHVLICLGRFIITWSPSLFLFGPWFVYLLIFNNLMFRTIWGLVVWAHHFQVHEKNYK